MSIAGLPIILWLVLIYATLAVIYSWRLSRKQRVKEMELFDLQEKLVVKQRLLRKKEKELNLKEIRQTKNKRGLK